MASVSRVLQLNQMGFGLQESKMALDKCQNKLDAAKTYLIMKSQAVCRYKKVRGKKVRWSDEDFVKYALTGEV